MAAMLAIDLTGSCFMRWTEQDRCRSGRRALAVLQNWLIRRALTMSSFRRRAGPGWTAICKHCRATLSFNGNRGRMPEHVPSRRDFLARAVSAAALGASGTAELSLVSAFATSRPARAGAAGLIPYGSVV